MSDSDAFFIRDGDWFVPTSHSLGYWVPNSLNGRAMGGLLGFALEEQYGAEGMIPARFCVDLFALGSNTPLKVASRLVRGGGRLRVAEAELWHDGVLVARASIQYVRETENPTNPTWQSPRWQVPAPETLAPDRPGRAWDVRPIPPAYATVARRLEPCGTPASGNPPVLGTLSAVAWRQAWVRDQRPVVAGTALTPFTHVALAADFASPLANSSEQGIDFVNTDFTVYLHRLPRTDWLGFDLVGHGATRGIAIGEAWLHDEDGPIGTVNVSAVAQRQRKG